MQVKKENICFSSKTIELSENENYIELTNRVCYYNVPNLNNVELPYDDGSLIKAKTLINMPVVAKYTTNSNGEPTFKGHEVYYDENGNIYFGTDNIGTHFDVYIKEDMVVTDLEGTTQRLPCLFAKYRIWKRNENVVNAVHRLYNEGKLYSSWEIETLSYQYDNNVKILNDYVFLGNCLLGYEYAYPAYGQDSKAIQMSQKESQLLVAEAFSKDLLENKSVSNINLQKEDKILDKQNKNIKNSKNSKKDSTEILGTEVVKNTDDGNNTETSENVVSVNSNIPEESVDEKDTIISTLKEKNNSLNSKVELLNSSIVEANAKIQTMSAQIAELIPFKEAADKAEKERIESETASKREQLKEHALKSGFITKDELSSDDKIKECISNVSKKDLDSIIAERFILSLNSKETKVKNTQETASIDTKKKNETVKANLVNTDDDELDAKAVMRAYLNK